MTGRSSDLRHIGNAAMLRPDVEAVVDEAERAGVAIVDLDFYRLTPDPARPGFVLGYGHVTAADLDRALDRLTQILR